MIGLDFEVCVSVFKERNLFLVVVLPHFLTTLYETDTLDAPVNS